MHFMKFFGGLAFAGASMALPAAPADAAQAQPADFKAKADAMVKAAFPSDKPGAAVLVTRRGRVIYAGGHGLADVEARRRVTPDTAFRLGSITKQFTAAAILQLVAEGKLSLDDPLSRFFPDWPQPSAGATVRQLLNHTSGIQDFSKVPGWIDRNRQRAFTTPELLATFRDRPARAKPGQAFEYNNGGYVLLGAIIEKLTGKSWHEAITERLTRPLGLRSFAYALPNDRNPRLARGYSLVDGKVQAVPASHPSVPHAAGGLVGNVRDMARWSQALHHGRVVTPALYQEMIKPARLADGSTQSYGFGLRQQQLRGQPILTHGGAGGGLDTDSLYVPSEDLVVSVFSNNDEAAVDPSALTRRLAALALGQPFPELRRTSVDPATLEPLFGAYGSERRFFTRGGKLYLGRGNEEREVSAAGEDRFFFGPGELAWFRIVRQPGGAHVLEFQAPDAAAPARVVRTGEVPTAFSVAPAVLRTYVGTYKTEALALTVALAEDGSLTITPAGQRPMPLRPVSTTEFRVDAGNMRVVFHPEGGRVDRMTVHRGARALNGQRVNP